VKASVIIEARRPLRSRVGPIAAEPWLEHLIRHLPVARAGEDPEGVHQVRVAAARLRVWLDLAGKKEKSAALKRLRRHAARVRDLDVHLEANPPAEVERTLRERRREARSELLAALDDPTLETLIEDLQRSPPTPEAQFIARIRSLARKTVKRGDRALDRPKDIDALHALRRSVRRLRFALEWIGERLEQAVELQDALGRLADRSTAIDHLATMGREGAVSEYRRHLERKLRKSAEAALSLWSEARQVFEDLARFGALRVLPSA
jgi:CHAD domain-containing protein